MSRLTRREWLTASLGAGGLLAFARAQIAAQRRPLTRTIPKTGEALPIIGLGSAATFSDVASAADITALREVFTTLLAQGGTVFDTAPSYGASEAVAGRMASELGATAKIFWATKVNAARRGRAADPAAIRAQIETSFGRIRKPAIDLIQVHNLGDVPAHLAVLRDLKQQQRIRYLGVTTTFEPQYAELANVMKTEALDFIGIDYAVDNREAERVILPIARDRGIGVLAYVPFGRTRLFRRVGDRPVPEWAREFDAQTWAQFFLKFVASHPAVTVVTPATSQARNMLDNMGAAFGRLPDETMRKRMASYIDALP